MNTARLLLSLRMIFSVIPTIPFFLVGCASSPSSPPEPGKALVIAIEMADGGKPTKDQIKRVYDVVAPEATKAGYRLVRFTQDADTLMVVTFTPDALNPTDGHARVRSIQPLRRPGMAIAGRGSTDTALSNAEDGLKQLEAWARSRESPTYP